mmetsp:Transcript_43095/g.93871  ORF Transcript_43095/g.93871 Transcript_43095/m.93871 type:complete len:145 (-) Transcript_43095:109-543(-)
MDGAAPRAGARPSSTDSKGGAVSNSAPAFQQARSMTPRGEGGRRLNVVSGGHNHIRDYVAAVLEEVTAPEGRRQVVLCARLKAMSKAISVSEVARRCAADEHGLLLRSSVALHGMREEGSDRRELPKIEITLQVQGPVQAAGSA